MEWIRYQAPSFTIEHPTNWTVRSLPEPGSFVACTPEADALAFVRSVYIPQCILPLSEILQDAEYLAECGFKNGKTELISSTGEESATGSCSYDTSKGSGRASLRCIRTKDGTVLEGFGALNSEFEQLQPLFVHILDSFRRTPAPAHAAAQPPKDPAKPAVLGESAAEIYKKIVQDAASQAEERKRIMEELGSKIRAAAENLPPGAAKPKRADEAFNNMDQYIRG